MSLCNVIEQFIGIWKWLRKTGSSKKHAHPRAEFNVSASDTTSGSEGTTCVLLGNRRQDTSEEQQPRKWKWRKFTSPNVGRGRSKGSVRLRDPMNKELGKESRSVSAHLILNMICCLFLSNWRLSYAPILPFFLPATICYLVVNKPLCSWTELCVRQLVTTWG